MVQFRFRDPGGVESVPPRGSGCSSWFPIVESLFRGGLIKNEETHPLPRGGTDFTPQGSLTPQVASIKLYHCPEELTFVLLRTNPQG